MAAMITSYCIRFADKCSVKGNVKGKDFEESFLQIYASAVSNMVCIELEIPLSRQSCC